MHFFPLHIGDYTTKAAHLSLLEDGVFNRLLRIYYDKERPLPVCVAEVQRLVSARSKDEKLAVVKVLHEFFRACDEGWRNEKADEIISAYRKKSEKAKASADARWTAKAHVAMADALEADANAMRTHSDGSANHKPITNNHRSNSKSTVRQAARFAEFWSVYPNKKGKQEAEKRWQRDGLDGMADQIIAHVRLMTARDDGWQRGFAPMGSTYLNQARWTDEPTGPALNRSAPGKQMTGLMALEEMKHGVVPQRNHHGHSEAGLFGLGASAGGGGLAGHGNGLAGSPRLALGSGNGHAPDPRGVLDLGPNGYRVADAAEAD